MIEYDGNIYIFTSDFAGEISGAKILPKNSRISSLNKFTTEFGGQVNLSISDVLRTGLTNNFKVQTLSKALDVSNGEYAYSTFVCDLKIGGSNLTTAYRKWTPAWLETGNEMEILSTETVPYVTNKPFAFNRVIATNIEGECLIRVPACRFDDVFALHEIFNGENSVESIEIPIVSPQFSGEDLPLYYVPKPQFVLGGATYQNYKPKYFIESTVGSGDNTFINNLNAEDVLLFKALSNKDADTYFSTYNILLSGQTPIIDTQLADVRYFDFDDLNNRHYLDSNLAAIQKRTVGKTFFYKDQNNLKCILVNTAYSGDRLNLEGSFTLKSVPNTGDAEDFSYIQAGFPFNVLERDAFANDIDYIFLNRYHTDTKFTGIEVDTTAYFDTVEQKSSISENAINVIGGRIILADSHDITFGFGVYWMTKFPSVYTDKDLASTFSTKFKRGETSVSGILDGETVFIVGDIPFAPDVTVQILNRSGAESANSTITSSTRTEISTVTGTTGSWHGSYVLPPTGAEPVSFVASYWSTSATVVTLGRLTTISTPGGGNVLTTETFESGVSRTFFNVGGSYHPRSAYTDTNATYTGWSVPGGESATWKSSTVVSTVTGLVTETGSADTSFASRAFWYLSDGETIPITNTFDPRLETTFTVSNTSPLNWTVLGLHFPKNDFFDAKNFWGCESSCLDLEFDHIAYQLLNTGFSNNAKTNLDEYGDIFSRWDGLTGSNYASVYQTLFI